MSVTFSRVDLQFQHFVQREGEIFRRGVLVHDSTPVLSKSTSTGRFVDGPRSWPVVRGESYGSTSLCTFCSFCSFKATGGIELGRVLRLYIALYILLVCCAFPMRDLEFQRETHAVSKPRETSIGPCRGLWLRFYSTLLRCSFIHLYWEAAMICDVRGLCVLFYTAYCTTGWVMPKISVSACSGFGYSFRSDLRRPRAQLRICS